MTASARAASPSQIACSSSRVLGDGVVEPGDAVEGEEPDPQRQGVVLVQRRLDERVVRAAVDVAVDALVELDQRPLVARVGDAGQLGEERARDLAVVGVRALGGEARGEALERDPRLREQREVADVDGRDDDAAPGIDLDELLLRERAQRLAHGRAPEPEPLHQLALADRGARRELEGDDQLTDAVVGLLAERQRPVGAGGSTVRDVEARADIHGVYHTMRRELPPRERGTGWAATARRRHTPPRRRCSSSALLLQPQGDLAGVRLDPRLGRLVRLHLLAGDQVGDVFWSFDVHLNFLITETAGEPLFANLPLITLSRR